MAELEKVVCKFCGREYWLNKGAKLISCPCGNKPKKAKKKSE